MLDAIVDKLTRSIEEVATGRALDTEITRASLAEVESLEASWRFDWRIEYRDAEVYKLTAGEHGPRIHGLISLVRRDDFIEVKLLESHPDNVGRHKLYAGVAGNLFAFAAKLSFDLGHDGFVAFRAKTVLIAHYEQSIGARRIGRGQGMRLESPAAERLVTRYFGGR